MKKKRLGRGLSGLIRPTEPPKEEDTPRNAPAGSDAGGLGGPHDTFELRGPFLGAGSGH